MSKISKAAQLESIGWLREHLMPGDTIFGIVKTVSRSGMSRTIDFYTLDKDRYRARLSGHIAAALGFTRSPAGAVKVSGCGMDMIFHVVYSTGRVLFRGGFTCPGDTCQSCDHTNGDHDRSPHHHSDGGYAFRYSSL